MEGYGNRITESKMMGIDVRASCDADGQIADRSGGDQVKMIGLISS